MSNRTRLKHARRVGTALVAGAASLIVPVAAQASAVNLGTTKPFVVLGATTVTNTGPSVLNGELGLSPGTSLTGFGFPAVVNGATHNNDAVAANAQSDLATAYNVAAGQPVPPGNVMTGLDLGGRTLAAGNYQYATSAQLTGQLTLDAAGDPSAQWVFKIGSTLTTASASSIILVNGASPCNVFWQVGSSATIDTTTAFKGNVLALTDITLNDAVTVQGRMMAINGQISLINDVLDNSMCNTSTTTPTPTTTDTSGAAGAPGSAPAAGTPGAPGTLVPPASRSTVPPVTRNGTAILLRPPHTAGSCTDGFNATVTGRHIKRVVFSLDGKRVASRSGSPYRVHVAGLAGRHNVTARVTFKDATRAKTLKLGYRACAAAVRNPRPGPSQFTG
jgi:hypothetical protein